RPKLLLADEPTANVDSGHQHQIIELMRETSSEENVSLLLVTHTSEVSDQFGRIERLEDFNQAVAAV
ncbi:MAG: ABC transporter ATP-binding protein, partial [Pirellulales bacterium]